MDRFPSMRWPELLRVLKRELLRYRVIQHKKSHKTLRATNQPNLHLTFHNTTTIPPDLVRKILVKNIDLTKTKTRALL